MTTPHAPQYIPSEVCGTVGADPATPPDQCLALVRGQIDADSVSAPSAVKPALLEVVDEAHQNGIDLKIVVLDHNPPNDPPLRDVATVVGSDHPDATVLVLSPNFVGSYSTHFPRSTLEIGEDNAKTGNPVVSAQNFLHQLNTPQFPWTPFTIVLLIAVLAAVVGTRVLQVRARRMATPAANAQTSTGESAHGA
ncbi:Rv1476 family membrane protein [Mycobacterium shimoidei]|uniref:Rv1476 family membrane protein n=1 Tax=Mycobacterium shimoidei TaxID=29313 RepID=UPI000A90CC7F